MTMNSGKTGSMTSEMNVTPLIDVLLVLLIIFMVIVPATPRGEAATEPQASRNDAPFQADAVVLEVVRQSDGIIGFRVNRQEISRQELPGRLAAIYANRAQRVLFVKGDGDSSFTQVADAIDIGHAAGADRVGLITPRIQVGQ